MESIETKSRVFFGGLLCEAFFFMLRENTFLFKFYPDPDVTDA